MPSKDHQDHQHTHQPGQDHQQQPPAHEQDQHSHQDQDHISDDFNRGWHTALYHIGAITKEQHEDVTAPGADHMYVIDPPGAPLRKVHKDTVKERGHHVV